MKTVRTITNYKLSQLIKRLQWRIMNSRHPEARLQFIRWQAEALEEEFKRKIEKL